MAALSDLRLDVVASLPNVPYPLADRAVRRAARELAEAVPLWQVTLADIALVQNQRIYPLTLAGAASGGEIVAVIERGALYDGRPLHLLTPEQAQYRGYYSTLQTGTQPIDFTMRDARTLMIFPAPAKDLDYPLQVTVQLRPSYMATAIDDAIALDYREGIVHGALWHLLAMPHESWASPQLSTYHRGLFLNERRQAIAAYSRGFARGNLRVRKRLFAGDTKAMYR